MVNHHVSHNQNKINTYSKPVHRGHITNNNNSSKCTQKHMQNLTKSKQTLTSDVCTQTQTQIQNLTKSIKKLTSDVCTQTHMQNLSKPTKSPTSDICTQTHIQNLPKSTKTLTPDTYDQTQVTSKPTKFRSHSSTKFKNQTKSKKKPKSKTIFNKSKIESFAISSLNDVPPENLLHCTFHIEGNPVTLLIDTGAGISVIRRDKIGTTLLNESDIISIVGISSTQSSTRSFGTANISLDDFPKFKFHVANLNIKVDGILGNDFMSKFNVNLYIQSKTMRVRNKTYRLHYLNEKIKTTNTNQLLLGSRTETVIPCKTNNLKTGTAIVRKQTIDNGIIIPHALVDVQDHSFLITCVNTNDYDQTITIPEIETEPFNDSMREINNYNKSTSSITNYDQNNQDKVRSLIRKDHLNQEEIASLDKIISKYSDIFYVEGDPLTFSSHAKHTIPTTSDIPINTKTYRIPQVHQQEVKMQMDKMLQQNIIRSSMSPWSSPIWVVPKKLDSSGKQKWRVVIDYRKLNDVTIGDSYPLPNITDILDKLGHSVYFTTLDLASGFHQIELDPKDIPKTAFNTPYGHYEFLRMPFGLKNAPATFQRAMDSVLYGLQGERCFVYLDDIVVFASSLQEHEQKLTEVFERLKIHGLKVQPDKCEFLRKEVAYLGHIISENGVKPNPEKVKSVRAFPVPKSCKDIKSFLGLAGYYRRFIPNFSKITKPMTSLLKKDVPFVWGSDQQQAFDTCKNILTTTPLLQYPDFSKEFVLTTDASLHAIGAILSQGEIGKDLPIAYASRTLNKAESNYSTIERELLAIVWAVKHFRPYLFGRKFKIVTDHKPLTWLFSIKDPGSRLVRWRLKLEEYEYEIVYKAGKINTNADALSRPPILNIGSSDSKPQSNDHLQTNYEQYKSQGSTSNSHKLKTSPNNLLDPRHKNIFIPVSCKNPDQNNLFNEAIDLCPQKDIYLKKFKDIYDVDHLISEEQQNLYFCCTRPEHFDPWDEESYFKSLISCLENNIETLYIPDLKSDLNCKLQGNQQLHISTYLAEMYNCDIVICSGKIKYPIPEDISEILRTYHNEPLSGHRGINETLRKIREEYYWKNMVNDIKLYINSCEICQRNKIQRKTFKAPMVITSQSSEPFERVSMDLVSYSDISDNNNKYILTLQDELTRYVQAYPIPDKEALTVAKYLLHFCQHFGVPKRFHSDQGTEFMNKLMKQFVKFLGSSQTFNTAYHPQTNGALERFHGTLRDHIRMYHTRKLKNWDQIIPLAIICHNTSLNTSTGYTPYELLFGYKPRPFFSLKPIPDYTASDYVKDLNERLRIARDAATNNVLKMKEKAKERYDSSIRNIARFKLGDKVMIKVPNPNNLDCKWEGPCEVIRVGFNENYLIKKSGKTQRVHANRIRPL